MMSRIPWRVWLRRARGLGYGRIGLLFGIVLVLVSLATPVWSISLFRDSANYSTTDFTWTSTTTQSFSGGSLNTITTQPYSSPLFQLHSIANAVSASYVMIAVFAIVLMGVFVLYSIPFGRGLRPLGHLVVSVIVVAVAFLALLYPVAVVPAQAAASLVIGGITGFFGGAPVTAGVNRPAGSVTGALTSATWGAGAGWWLLLAGLILGILGAIVPYLRVMFRPIPPPPAGWRPQP